MFTWRAFGPSITLANRKMYAKRSPILKQVIILLSNKTSPETLFSLAFMRPHATRNIADNELEICWAKSKLRLRCVRAVLQYLGQESESTKKRQPITDFSACFEAIDHACGPRAAAATINPWNVNRIAQRLPLLPPGLLAPPCRGKIERTAISRLTTKQSQPRIATERSIRRAHNAWRPILASRRPTLPDCTRLRRVA
jgi:hypothetical protein